jgi:tRNA(adenine34) deaminase
LRWQLAEEAAAGEVPVGCVITGPDGGIIGRGRNMREETGDASAHAEVLAIREACRALGSWRLDGCVMYVTLEPCPMCAGAVINSRHTGGGIRRQGPATGSCGSVINLFEERYGHRPAVYGGVLEAECSAAAVGFFKTLR